MIYTKSDSTIEFFYNVIQQWESDYPCYAGMLTLEMHYINGSVTRVVDSHRENIFIPGKDTTGIEIREGNNPRPIDIIHNRKQAWEQANPRFYGQLSFSLMYLDGSVVDIIFTHHRSTKIEEIRKTA